MKQSFLQQFTPIILTVVTFVALGLLLLVFIHILNLFPISDKIVPVIRLGDILIGLTIYLKTSVDFAIFIGNLMAKNQGWKNRIAIEIGTALGNGIGTFLVLLIWTFFKEVPLLMIIMIVLAALVLFGMAEEGLREFCEKNYSLPFALNKLSNILLAALKKINKATSPLLHFILPQVSSSTKTKTTFFALLIFSLTVPLILGLDDFAGYIPLFNIVNVFGFAIGVFLGHMLLNLALFASPRHTITVVKQPIIGLLGSLAFIGIALWGFYEAYEVFLTLFH